MNRSAGHLRDFPGKSPQKKFLIPLDAQLYGSYSKGMNDVARKYSVKLETASGWVVLHSVDSFVEARRLMRAAGEENPESTVRVIDNNTGAGLAESDSFTRCL
mgnify:CR=1 FL=1